MGIDIQIRRNCCYAVINGTGTVVDSGWFSEAETEAVKEFVEGRGSEVGGRDGLGSIVLPRPLPEPVINEVLLWPQ
jgi:hypothetical protein